jgi:copper homeostasis protein
MIIPKPLLEICVDSVESALAAQEGGAARVEFCDNLFEGGTTPSAGMIAIARQHLTIGLHVIIRPRGGDFLFSDVEFEVMKRDIEVAREQRADGVVIGILKEDGTIDAARTRQLIEIARPLRVTFHRAFDMTCNPYDALEELIALGIERVLTSGQQAEVPEGLPLIAELVKQARDRIIVMPGGGGIAADNIAIVARRSGAREIHLGATTRIDSGMVYRNPRVSMGSPYTPSEYSRLITDAGQIRKMVAAVSTAASANG